jgi:SNF2 family DNA or RNA helicase
MLRQTRCQVLSELPPRTDIVRSVPLEQGQAGLYEVVRAAMDKRVREAIRAKGLGQSQIIVLDALLKLRQICCDPRLLKLPAAKKVKESAKLESFRQLTVNLVEEGRRILVFSQFTSRLELLERCLSEEKIAFLKLTGYTPESERAEIVKRFQDGEVPVFLISLKAGGSGLNLTAADTVIHYDPWWNPAVEDQATGRAHRMGQQNPVFVYRLITEGTIEERILDLQKRKAAIAKAILEGDDLESGAGLAIDRADLEHLLAPI